MVRGLLLPAWSAYLLAALVVVLVRLVVLSLVPRLVVLEADARSRLLGCDRRTTLQRLLDDGVLDAVPGARGVRLRRDQVEQLLLTGIPPPGSRRPPRQRRRRRAPAGDATSVRDAILGIVVK